MAQDALLTNKLHKFGPFGWQSGVDSLTKTFLLKEKIGSDLPVDFALVVQSFDGVLSAHGCFL